MSNVDRNYGIDLLKIFSVFLIITLHVLSWGGILDNLEVGSIKYFIFWFIEAIAYVAVNCYALVSGYLNVNKEFKISKIFKLWLQVLFYTFGFTVIFAIFIPNVVGITEWIKSVFPVMFNQYWYFTSYFVVFLFSPYLNFILQKLPKEKLKKLILLLIVIFSLLPTIRCYDVFHTNYGYSIVWLAIMYIVGGYIRLVDKKFSKKEIIKITSIWLLSTAITAGSRYFSDLVLKGRFSLFSENALYSYTSITVVIASIALVLLFSTIRINKFKKAIVLLSNLSFGVYLIHVNYFVWNYIIESRFAFIVEYNIIQMLLIVLLNIFVIYILCIIIEYIRTLIFKLLRVDNVSKFFEIKLGNFLEIMINKI